MSSISRRAFLTVPCLVTPAAAYARFVEPAWLECTERFCPIPKLTRPVELVHLSDFHASTEVPRSLIERAVEKAIEASPGVICITGDFVTFAMGFDPNWYISVLRRLTSHAPTFAVLGNHDGGLWAASGGGFQNTAEVGRMVERAGIHLLANASARITCNEAVLQIVGVGDLWAGELDPPKAFRDTDESLPTILLSHNPDSKAMLGNYRWDLMLSGHTHGGQVVLPLVGLSPAPVWDRRYIAGLKRWGDRWIHVSRGVGNVRGVRFNCRPELTRIRLAQLPISPATPGEPPRRPTESQF